MSIIKGTVFLNDRFLCFLHDLIDVKNKSSRTRNIIS